MVPPAVEFERDERGVGRDELLLGRRRGPLSPGAHGQHLRRGTRAQRVHQHHVGVVLAPAVQLRQRVLSAVPADLLAEVSSVLPYI